VRGEGGVGGQEGRLSRRRFEGVWCGVVARRDGLGVGKVS